MMNVITNHKREPRTQTLLYINKMQMYNLNLRVKIL